MKAIAIPDGKFQIVDQNAGKTVSMIDISPLQTTGQFAWSPDGKQLAFYANFYSLYIYSLETQEYRSIEEIKSLGFNGYMDWSPDGNWIAFGGGKDRSISKIYLIHPDGTGLHQLSPYYFHGYAQVTSWTSDGQYLLFSILKEAGSRKCFYDIWISDIDGKQPKLLAENIKCGLTDVAVSPDGKTIYYGVESGTYMSPIECYYENSCERIPSGSTFQFPDTWYKSFVPRWTGSYPTYYDVYPED
jgi:Tol biopolymer transport system component